MRVGKVNQSKGQEGSEVFVSTSPKGLVDSLRTDKEERHDILGRIGTFGESSGRKNK